MNAPVRIPNRPTPAGDNNPPADPTPFDLSQQEIEGLFVEGRNWLDGSAIQSQDEADAVGKLLALTKAAIALADERRAIEVKPLNDAKAEIQDRYNQLIGETKAVTGRAIVLQGGLQAVLTPWRQKLHAERRAAEDAAHETAEQARREAAVAFQVTSSTDLEGREYAEQLARDARAAAAAAKKAGKPVATGLRTRTIATLNDRRAFLNWIAANRADELTEWLQGMAQRLCDAKFRDLPGLSYADETRAQ